MPIEENPLLTAFMRTGGRVVHKWLDYFDVYHRYFSRFRGERITFVEIGVQNGGSLRMWRDYFGPQARLIGVDVDPRCKALEAEGFEIWIGDQASPEFWQEFLSKTPSLDIVLDDGGHTMEQQINTFKALFPALVHGGVFLCEDTHTSYFPGYGGGLRREGSFHEYIKGLIDEMHAWYHAPLPDIAQTAMAQQLYSLAVYDSIVVMEKRLRNPPLALVRGQQAHTTLPITMNYLELRRAVGIPD